MSNHSAALAADAVVIVAVEAVRVGHEHLEAPERDIAAVQVRRRWNVDCGGGA